MDGDMFPRGFGLGSSHEGLGLHLEKRDVADIRCLMEDARCFMDDIRFQRRIYVGW